MIGSAPLGRTRRPASGNEDARTRDLARRRGAKTNGRDRDGSNLQRSQRHDRSAAVLLVSEDVASCSIAREAGLELPPSWRGLVGELSVQWKRGRSDQREKNRLSVWVRSVRGCDRFYSEVKYWGGRPSADFRIAVRPAQRVDRLGNRIPRKRLPERQAAGKAD